MYLQRSLNIIRNKQKINADADADAATELKVKSGHWCTKFELLIFNNPIDIKKEL